MENNSWKTATSTFKGLIRFLESLPDEQKCALTSGKAKVVFDLQPMGAKSKALKPWNQKELVKKLNEFSIREEAELWIKEATLSKRQLQEALRSIDVPWDKSDNVERLREKLIENTIGFKLRSRAIQGK